MGISFWDSNGNLILGFIWKSHFGIDPQLGASFDDPQLGATFDDPQLGATFGDPQQGVPIGDALRSYM